MTSVPNELRPDCKIAIVGEAPGENEVFQQRPFVGGSGQLLFSILGQSRLTRSDVSLLNVCQIQPPKNQFDLFQWDGFEIQDGIARLRADLQTIHPNIVVACGNAALHVLTEGNTIPPRGKYGYDYPRKVSSWRGSIIQGFLAPKVIASLHPAYVLRAYDELPLFKFDISRAAQQSATPDLPMLKRNFVLHPTLEYILDQLRRILLDRTTISIDIEGGIGNITCIGIATSTEDAFIIPFGEWYWKQDEEVMIWRELAKVLASSDVPKILQNYLYDAFVLGWWARCPVNGLAEDTMLKHHELFAELPKSLALQTSIYTLQPYYKFGRKKTGTEHLEYCLTDCVVTYECSNVMEKLLDGASREHYRKSLATLAPFLYMQMKGISYDVRGVADYKRELAYEINERQAAIDMLHHGKLNCSLRQHTKEGLIDVVATNCCYKKYTYRTTDDLRRTPKKSFIPTIGQMAAIIDNFPNITPAEYGFLEAETGIGLNVDSSPQMQSLLYSTLGYKPRYKKEKGRRTDRLSADVNSILDIFAESGDRSLLELLRLRQVKDRLSAMNMRCDADNRMRCSYNIVGTVSGRVSSSEAAHGVGTNMQNRTKSQRMFWRADPGMWFWQADLVGADGYTVAAHAASLGDPTMLDDYSAGVKPKNVIALMYLFGEDVNRLSRDELKEWSKTRLDAKDKHAWLLFAAKVVQHGCSYGMYEATIADNIAKRSFKETEDVIFVDKATCGRLRRLFLNRYPGIEAWHRQCRIQLVNTGVLHCASGHTRRFYGRRKEDKTLREYLAEEPQQNTTYLTNTAALNLWLDPENRRDDNSPIIETLLQVHDAIGGQFPKSRLDWAKDKIRKAFNIPLTIGKITLTIPFEGSYGPSWGEEEGEL